MFVQCTAQTVGFILDLCYTVQGSVGKVGTAEVDFIAIGEDGEEYYQVAYTLEGEARDKNGKTVLERELAPLETIKDHNPKYLLTMDFTPKTSHNGIKQINALDWLLSE